MVGNGTGVFRRSLFFVLSNDAYQRRIGVLGRREHGVLILGIGNRFADLSRTKVERNEVLGPDFIKALRVFR